MNIQSITSLFKKNFDPADVASKSMGKINKLLDEYNEAIEIIGNLGFKIEKFNVGATGVETSISGTLDKIDKDKTAKLAELHKERKIIVSILKALITAKLTQERVKNIPLKGLRLDMKLGWPPKMDMEFLTEL